MGARRYTDYPELDELFIQHTKMLQVGLGDNFVGYYLQGSLATGGFDQTSDVDFIVVVKNELSESEVKKVQAIHDDIYQLKTKWAKHLEYSFFPLLLLQQSSSPFTESGVNEDNEKLWYFDNGSQTIEKNDHCNTLVTRWTLYNKGIAIAGPPASGITNPVDPNDLRREIRNTMLGWGRVIFNNPDEINNRFYQSYLVLNYCRMLHDLHTSTIDSKLTGMIWAKKNLDHNWADLIDYCWNERQDPDISIHQPADQKRYLETLEFVRYAITLAERFVIVPSR
jgi:hypothetical protein